MVPALAGDADTAMWGLEANVGPEKGAVFEYTNDAGDVLTVKLVGQLPMRLSVFQGSMLIGEHDFAEHFPSEEGCRMFLWDDSAQRDELVKIYARSGLDIIRSVDRLLEFYTVESTYLAMFLVLGILGLITGSLGMGIVVLRNVQDRRSETALLKAVGFRDEAIRTLLNLEHGLLAVVGLGIGMISAAVAMVPALTVSESDVSVGMQVGLLLVVAVCCLGCMAGAVAFSVRGDALRGLRDE
jgi:hypothetical protein